MLELEVLLAGVSQGLQVGNAGFLDHGRRAAKEYDRVRPRGRHRRRQHCASHKPLMPAPALWRGVQREMHFELPWPRPRKRIECPSQEYVPVCFVGVEQRELKLVFWVRQHSLDELKHRREAAAACNHAHALEHAPLFADHEAAATQVLKLAFWAARRDPIANREALEVRGHLARRVQFHKHIHEARLPHRRDWGVGSGYVVRFGGVVHRGKVEREQHVLPDGKPEFVLRRR
mmetsp:Transcript_18683/g.59607  ORF Transcript_18683/g.59607 Transcript_18683/m.59607 type:complete len:232 (+) Transcript_18683:1370-2065(+)